MMIACLHLVTGVEVCDASKAEKRDAAGPKKNLED